MKNNTNATYYADLGLAAVVRIVLFCSSLVIIGMCIAGCSIPTIPTLGTVERGQLSPLRLSDGTRNDLPQGGDHEKSDCAPREPGR
uniref:Uncharacterized protein n=1 Tax=Leviviridae sp. TaxID=2027243 RepID=A0A514D238_9VIRU|nr:MAG: hypothetical protein H2Bulk352406e1880_000002 [Leviviridae sp.]